MSFQFSDIRAGFSMPIESEELLLSLWNDEAPWLKSPIHPTVFRGQPDATYWTRSKFARDYIAQNGDPIDGKVVTTDKDIRSLSDICGEVPDDYHEQSTAILNGFKKGNSVLRDETISHAALGALAQHYGKPTDFLDFTFDLRVALYFAFERNEAPDCGYVSVSVSTPWAFAEMVAWSASQNRFIELSELLPHIITEDENSGVTFPHPDRIGREVNARLAAQKACVIRYPGMLPYEFIMNRLYWNSQFKQNRLLLFPFKLKSAVQELLASSGISQKTLLLTDDHAVHV